MKRSLQSTVGRIFRRKSFTSSDMPNFDDANDTKKEILPQSEMIVYAQTKKVNAVEDVRKCLANSEHIQQKEIAKERTHTEKVPTQSEDQKKTPPATEAEKRLQAGKCPSGKHTDLKENESCLCTILNKLLLYQNEDIASRWHWSFSDKIKLTDMQLKRPTKCVQGGQGMVFWVNEKNTGREFALKMKLREMRSRLAWVIERREASILKQIEHEFIVNLFHVFETKSAMFMIMEYLEGGCLWSHIAHIGLLPENYSAYYTACILEALQYLHKLNIIFRDMKAENIVLDWQGKPRLIDFGMAKKINRTEREEADEPYPTTNYYFAAYLAPEIYMDSCTSDFMVDSWGLGYIVSEIVLGFGVYVPMPWEKQEGKHIKPGWELQLPSEAEATDDCKDFLHKMLIQNANSRLTLSESKSHPFFCGIKWDNLIYRPAPNLNELKRRTRKSLRATFADNSGTTGNNSTTATSRPTPVATVRRQNRSPGMKNVHFNPHEKNASNCGNKSTRGQLRSKKTKINNELQRNIMRALGLEPDEEEEPKIYETVGNLKHYDNRVQ